jgi:hypothetical protein
MPDCPVYTAPSVDFNATQSDLLSIFKGQMAVMRDVQLQPSGHVSAADLQSKYNEIKDKISLTPMILSGSGTYQLPAGSMPNKDLDTKIYNDGLLLQSLQDEYCFYNSRYAYALDKFFQYATSNDSSQSNLAATMLSTTKTLNVRTTFIMEFMNYVTQLRIPPAQGDARSIDTLNTKFNTKIQELMSTKALLDKENAMVVTQKEMVRYTADKNSATMKTVLFWGAANVLALGAIGAVYTLM